MTKFLFVVATKHTEDYYNNLPLAKCLDRINTQNDFCIETKIFYNNSKGLSELYNSILDDKSNDGDFIIFLHDDLYINDCFIFDKLIEASKCGDIIGLCGGKAWIPYGNINNPMLWTTASGKQGMSGFMCHALDKDLSNVEHKFYYNGRTLSSSNYGFSPAQVLTIDGCFMCFTKKAVEKGVKFDNRFKFHYYDIDMCFNAFTKQVPVVTYPILATHESLGIISNNDEYISSQKEFLYKWFEIQTKKE